MKFFRARLFVLTIASLVGAVILASALPASAAASNPLGADEGYDVSWPQCSGDGSVATSTLPTPGAFTVLGVDGGRPFTENSCLASLLTWAKSGRIQLYANTANPGPAVYNPDGSLAARISNWPIPSRDSDSANRPKPCTDAIPDSIYCAYDYGYKGARTSYAHAVEAFQRANLPYAPNAVNWWLDLEITNTWRGHDAEFPEPRFTGLSQASLDARNRASMQGAQDYLLNVAHVRQLGYYGSPNEWAAIMNSTTAFADHPYWYPIGGATTDEARAACADTRNVTGSGLPVMVQHQVAGRDINVPCYPSTSLVYMGTSVALPHRIITLATKLVNADGTPIHGVRVYWTVNRVSYSAMTSPAGIATAHIYSPSVRRTYSVFTYTKANSYAASSATGSLRVR